MHLFLKLSKSPPFKHTSNASLQVTETRRRFDHFNTVRQFDSSASSVLPDPIRHSEHIISPNYLNYIDTYVLQMIALGYSDKHCHHEDSFFPPLILFPASHRFMFKLKCGYCERSVMASLAWLDLSSGQVEFH